MTDDDRAVPLACELAGHLREAACFFTPLNIDIAQEVMRSAGRIEQVAKRSKAKPEVVSNVIERVYNAIAEDALTNSSAEDDSVFLAPLREVQDVD